jgi:hypothetical protein
VLATARRAAELEDLAVGCADRLDAPLLELLGDALVLRGDDAKVAVDDEVVRSVGNNI